jgi:hypothetical protein
MKTIKIKDNEYTVPDEVHDLLHFYSRTLQVATIMRKAQKEYYQKQDQTTLRTAKALEKRFDDLIQPDININEQNLFR